MVQINLTLDEPCSAVQITPIPTNRTLRLGDRLLDLSTPRVMGILNTTPDSFFSGSRSETVEAAVRNAGRMLEDGAELIDVGGYSTRPGADDVSEAEEVNRVIPVIRALRQTFPSALISVDTFRSGVAHAALDLGAVMVNDVTAATADPNLLHVAASFQAALVLMHMRGTPATMSSLTHYEHLVSEVALHLKQRVSAAEAAGIRDIVIDPGFGFAKTPQQNFQLLRNLTHLQLTGRPVLAGLSRKSMIWRTLGITPEQALNGTSALNMAALMHGASVLRVHDVREAVEVVRLYTQLISSGS